MKFIPFATFEPDKPAYSSNASRLCRNVIPKTKQVFKDSPPQITYTAAPSLNAYSEALDAYCRGARGIFDASGNSYFFAGDATKLYELVGSNETFLDVSKAGGYNTADAGFWRSIPYQNHVVFTNYTDPMQVFTIGTSTDFDDLSADAPKAKFLDVVRNWLVTANTYDSTDGARPTRIWWSAFNNITSWPEPGTDTAAQVQSGWNELPTKYGEITGIVGGLGGADGAVIQEHAIHVLNYAGPPAVWSFDMIEGSIGSNIPNAIVHMGSKIYYPGEDGFYTFDGQKTTAIGEGRVNKWFYSKLEQNYTHRVVGIPDPINQIIFWSFPSTSSSQGNPDTILVYHALLDEWSYIELTCETLCLSVGFGQDVESMTGILVDSLNVPVDSRFWIDKRILLGAFDTQHRLNYLNGPPLEVELETLEYEPIQGRRSTVCTTRPIVDGSTPSVATLTKNLQTETPVISPYIQANDNGYSPQRRNGRYLRHRIKLPAGGGFSHASGIEVDIAAGGGR